MLAYLANMAFSDDVSNVWPAFLLNHVAVFGAQLPGHSCVSEKLGGMAYTSWSIRALHLNGLLASLFRTVQSQPSPFHQPHRFNVFFQLSDFPVHHKDHHLNPQLFSCSFLASSTARTCPENVFKVLQGIMCRNSTFSICTRRMSVLGVGLCRRRTGLLHQYPR